MHGRWTVSLQKNKCWPGLDSWHLSWLLLRLYDTQADNILPICTACPASSRTDHMNNFWTENTMQHCLKAGFRDGRG